ncbi:flippase activity-associated protein Agl23, partial [Chloroflexota bacterium]
RFWDLGARAMSHDESLHALYSYYLYNGTGYTHTPMMHGPFLFHANALVYFLFGDSDYSARIVPALFGVFLVLSPILLRRWLGKTGAILTSIFLLISPSILYYSRYIRNDVYIAVWTILLIAALFHFLRDRKRFWFYLGAVVLMLSLATKENAYIFGYIGLVFIIEAYLWERTRPRSQIWLYLGSGVLAIALMTLAYFLGRPPAEGVEAVEAAESAGGALKFLTAIVVVVSGTIPAVLLSALIIPSRHPRRSSVERAFRSLPWQAWLVAILVMFIIYALLFTTFFTNPAGLVTGVGGSIGYWLAQQEVQRGGQPWYYYLLLLPMYEMLPLLFSLVAMLYYLVKGIRDKVKIRREEDVESSAAIQDIVLGSDAGSSSTVTPAARAPDQILFVAFMIFWTVTTLFIYSWAGEKMPWLVVHPVLPMIVLTGEFVGEIFDRVDWRAIWRRGGALLLLLLPVTLFGIYTLLKVRPFQGLSIFKLQETGNWLAALAVTILLVILTAAVVRRLGIKYSAVVAVAGVLILASFFTVRFAWMATFRNYDYATEFLVYAHGAPGATLTMNEVADISERTVGDKMIEVAYDNEVTWPLEWYLREYPNRKYYGETPTREQLDVPIVLSSERNDAKAEPFLGDRYYKDKRRLVWWPNQQYMDLTWDRIRDILASPEKREILWKILYYREYPRSTDDWYHVHNFYMYVRKDVAQQLWDFGAVPPEVLELPPDPYLEADVNLSSESAWGGAVGTAPGQFNHPRGIAVGPDDQVFVADSDNHRVQVFDRDGTFLREWGSRCQLDTGQGCTDTDGDGPMGFGDGQFQEPWGIAVDHEGNVYVADTWNHRIQAFDSDGTYLTKWGSYGQTSTEMSLFYGPRDVAVDAAGRVFVTDTGNKRVVVFDRIGQPLYQWGGGGVGPGSFEEPVGIAVDDQGYIYVVDTWNQRVQVFDGDYTFLREWPVDAWYGESVVNKPFIAVDGLARVYITDPEGYRVAVFDNEGDLQATFGRYGFDAVSFSLPTGVDVDSAGSIYVTDTDGQRVLKFEPLP